MADKAKHTPGPWKYHRDWNHIPSSEVKPHSPGSISNGEYWVAMIENAPEAKANARLITAAPDLLEACKALADESQEFLAMADRETHGKANIAVLRLRIKEAFDATTKAEGKR